MYIDHSTSVPPTQDVLDENGSPDTLLGSSRILAVILVKLHDGLCNQMFQYAAARRLAAAHKTSVRIDTSWYDSIPAKATPRTFELDKFQITGTRASHWETIGTDGVRNTPRRELPVALYRKVRPRYRFVGERQFHFDPGILQLPDNVCLFGYWMSEKYFVDIAETIRREFAFRDPPDPDNEEWATKMREGASVAVHVRRGDYVNDPEATAHQGLCSVDYYNRAIEFMRARVPEARFFVFSDDLDWARDNLMLGEGAEFVSNNRGAASDQDLRLMTFAHHNILANSSFSWWGAWLNQNVSKLVVAPRRWMNDLSFDTRDILPSDWISL
jgi:hypothetical protein